METLLFGNIGTGDASDRLTGGSFSWPRLKVGQTAKIGWRPIQTIGGENSEVFRDVVAMRAGIGLLDEKPTSGKFHLSIKDTEQAFTAAGATLTANAHGLSDDDLAFVTSSDELPDLLLEDTLYYVVNATENTFELALSPGGAAIVTGGAGTGLHYVQQVTPAINFDDDGDALALAISALASVGDAGEPYGLPVADGDGKSWIFQLGDGRTETIFTVHFNSLRPISFVLSRRHEAGGIWENELRMVQAPIAFTDQRTEEIHTPPKIEELDEGFTVGENLYPASNKVTFNPLYRGFYVVRRNGLKTRNLDRDDGPTQWQEALQAIADEGGVFRVENPTAQIGHVFFEGEMAGIPQDPLIIEPIDGPPGDNYIILDLGEYEAISALRAAGLDTADQKEFEIAIEVDYKDPNDEERILTWSYSGPVTVRRELLVPEIAATVKGVDYARPYNPKKYRPYSKSQTTVGHAAKGFDLGGLVTESFVHGLNSPNIIPIVWPKVGAIKPLRLHVDYEIEQISANEVEITLLGDYNPAPGANSLRLLIMAMEDTSAFDDHDHVISDVELLQEKLDLIFENLALLNTLLPTGKKVIISTSSASKGLNVWNFPPLFEILPMRRPLSVSQYPEGRDLAAYLDGRSPVPATFGGFVPAIHSAEVAIANLSTIYGVNGFPDPAAEAGKVFLVNAAAIANSPDADEILIPGSRGRSSERVVLNEYVLCDGNSFYRGVAYGRGHTPVSFTADAAEGAKLLTCPVQHRLIIGNRVRCSTTDTLPAPFVAGTDYFVAARNEFQVSLSATLGGEIIDPTTAGVGVHTLTKQDDSSFYPGAFEKELLIGAVNGGELTLRSAFKSNLGIELAVIPPVRRRRQRETRVHWSFCFQFGAFTEDAAPGVPGLNLGGIAWDANFAFEHRVHVTRTPRVHSLGWVISRFLDGGSEKLSLDYLVSGLLASGMAPKSEDFAFRLMLAKFDTENQVSDPYGLVGVSGFDRTTEHQTILPEPFGYGIIE